MTQRQAVGQLLDKLEIELKRLELWQTRAPAEAALASTLPFAVDTLEFHQWLQFILLVRLRQLLELQAPLPSGIAVYPMATEVYQQRLSEHRALLEIIALLDESLSGRPVER